MSNRVDCLICGAELVYLTRADMFACAICGRSAQAEVRCADGHYVCDTCHAAPANAWIEAACLRSPERNPVRLAEELMRSPLVKMHGPEHHYLVPAVLLTAYYNALGQPDEKQGKLRTARQRAGNVLGGFCGFYGACGAGVGTGIFVSLITDATPLSTDAWSLANRMTAESLADIAARGGPRCCKRDTFLALRSAVAFTREHFSVELELDDTILCTFSDLNRECLQQDCPFHVNSMVV